MKHLFALLICALPLITLANPSEIAVSKLSDSAYMLKAASYNTNIGAISTQQGLVLIDPMPGNDNIAELNRVINDLFKPTSVFILNTHNHDDHTGGNSFFVSNGAVVLTAAEALKGIKLATVKSHSGADQIIFHQSSNSIFVGDIYDTSWHPTFYAGGVSGFTNAIDTILGMADDNTLIIPGHGKPTGKAALQQFKANTLQWVAQVKELKQQGKTVQQIMADKRIKTLLLNFNVENNNEFIPEKAFERFIERTLTVIENEV